MADNRATLKTFFETGDFPNQAQFAALIDGLMSVEDPDTIKGIKTFDSNIIIADAKVIKALSGGGQINLRSGNVDGQVDLTSDNGGFTEGFFFITPESAELGFSTTGSVVATALGVIISASIPDRITVFATGITIGSITGKIGLFGKSPIVQPAAIPDTSGATLAQLEDEVNKLKAAMRSLGSIKI